MLFISSKKFFSFSRYLNFYLDFLFILKKDLIRKIMSIETPRRQNLLNKKLRYTYCPISQKVKTTRQ